MNRVFNAIGFMSLALGATTACNLEPQITPANGAPGNGLYGAPGGPGNPVAPIGPVAPPGGTPFGCGLDTRQVVETNGRFFEVVTSRGRLFEFENGAPVQPGVGLPNFAFPQPGAIDLTSVPLYQQGPCMGRAQGTCEFDTQAFVLLPGTAHIREYVTAMGRQWVFENNMMTGAGVPLDVIPRYREICELARFTGTPCTFDTRTFVKLNGVLVESITAYGHIFEYDIDGNPLPESGFDLAELPKYAQGPCLNTGPGRCAFETRTFEPVNGQLTETVTVNAHVFRYLQTGQPIPGSGVPIASAVHWATGPCQ